MGCCTSRETSSPYDQTPPTRALPSSSPTTASHGPDSSRAAINTPLAPAPPPPRQGGPTAADQRPNKPLRAPSPVPHSPDDVASAPAAPWTRTELARQRDAFFDTRVSGDAQVWAGLGLVAEMLRNEELQGAQALLDSMGLTCPTGRIVEGAAETVAPSGETGEGEEEEEEGRRYAVPGWVVRDPDDVVEDKEERMGAVGDEEEEKMRLREEKGKGRAEEVGEVVRVRARLSDRGTDVLVDVGRAQRVAVLVRRVQEKAGLKGKLRLAYLGRILEEAKTLEDQGWREGHVVNALVFE
ncbi:hypothetical protein H2203_003300 [Taxawa tesnikishii (nom. ined.)]|nr:hypothetical protein H2203_003300 [Dothideales sp. JES 119]